MDTKEKQGMSQALMIGGFIVLAVVCLFLIWLAVKPGKAQQTWPAFAAEMGLTHNPPQTATAINAGSIEGTYNGYQIRIEAKGRMRLSDAMVTTIRFQSPLGAEILLNAGDCLDGPPADTGRQSFQTASRTFDILFQPKAMDTSAATAQFQSQYVLAKLMNLESSNMGIRINDEAITIYAHEVVQSPEKLKKLLDELVEIASAIEKGSK